MYERMLLEYVGGKYQRTRTVCEVYRETLEQVYVPEDVERVKRATLRAEKIRIMQRMVHSGYYATLGAKQPRGVEPLYTCVYHRRL